MEDESAIITERDIDYIRNSAVILTSEKDRSIFIRRLRKEGSNYNRIKCGYFVNLLVDAIDKKTIRQLLSVYNKDGKTEMDMAKQVADSIFKDNYELAPNKYNSNFIDFIKIIERNNKDYKLTEEDITKVRKSIERLGIDNIINKIEEKFDRISGPTLLSNWYKASLSINVLNEKTRLIHLSVSNALGKTDPAVAQEMADAIIGEDNKNIGSMFYPNAIHFMKEEKADTLVEMMKNSNIKKIISEKK